MAFDINNFKEVGGNRNFVDGGQVYTLHSSTDTVSTMLADSYLDDLNGTLNVRDTIILNGSDFTQVARIATNSTGVVKVTSAQVHSPAEELVSPGAVGLTTLITDLQSSGADAITIADGVIGQVKIINFTIDGGNPVTLTPATPLGFSTAAFGSIGDSLTLLFCALGWVVIGTGGVGTGTTIA